jgi:hypothetical protein
MLSATLNTFAAELRESFQPRLRRLGANVGVSYCRHDAECDGVQEVQTLFVSCPREEWVAQFGEPQHVRQCFDPHAGRWRQDWEHALADGRIRCVGDMFTRSSGRDWVIVRRLEAIDADAA